MGGVAGVKSKLFNPGFSMAKRVRLFATGVLFASQMRQCAKVCFVRALATVNPQVVSETPGPRKYPL